MQLIVLEQLFHENLLSVVALTAEGRYQHVCVFAASEVPGVVTRFGASAAIGCTVSNTQRIRVGLSWAKDGKPITRNEHYNITEIETDSEASSSINITRVGAFI